MAVYILASGEIVRHCYVAPWLAPWLLTGMKMIQKVSRPRLELRTFCVLDRCDNQLRHRPHDNDRILCKYILGQLYVFSFHAEDSLLRMLTAKVHSNFAVAFSILVASRLWLSLTDLSNILKHDQQLSSPLTSFLQRAHSSSSPFMRMYN